MRPKRLRAEAHIGLAIEGLNSSELRPSFRCCVNEFLEPMLLVMRFLHAKPAVLFVDFEEQPCKISSFSESQISMLSGSIGNLENEMSTTARHESL